MALLTQVLIKTSLSQTNISWVSNIKLQSTSFTSSSPFWVDLFYFFQNLSRLIRNTLSLFISSNGYPLSPTLDPWCRNFYLSDPMTRKLLELSRFQLHNKYIITNFINKLKTIFFCRMTRFLIWGYAPRKVCISLMWKFQKFFCYTLEK